jgi:hypothetical protein
MSRGKGTPQHNYTPEQLDFIRENIRKMTWKELAPLFNDTFGTNLSYKALAATGKRYGIKSGRTGCFPKGAIPWNKGKKGWKAPGTEKTWFKKGNIPHNWVPVGSERITIDGYVEMKIQEGKFQKNWKGKHILVWEQYHGRPVPPGHAVIFGDGNNRNFDPENLLLVSRAQLARMNQLGLIKNDAKLTKTGVLIADVLNKAGELKKRRGGKD